MGGGRLGYSMGMGMGMGLNRGIGRWEQEGSNRDLRLKEEDLGSVNERRSGGEEKLQREGKYRAFGAFAAGGFWWDRLTLCSVRFCT